CTLVDAQHLRCVSNIPPNSFDRGVSYDLIGDVPGTYQAKATVTLAGDENPANDSVQWNITINPATDAGLRDFTMPKYLVIGHDATVPLTVYTGARPVPGVLVTVSTQIAKLASVSSPVGACTRVGDQAFSCALGDLAGGSEVNLSAVVTSGATNILGDSLL